MPCDVDGRVDDDWLGVTLVGYAVAAFVIDVTCAGRWSLSKHTVALYQWQCHPILLERLQMLVDIWMVEKFISIDPDDPVSLPTSFSVLPIGKFHRVDIVQPSPRAGAQFCSSRGNYVLRAIIALIIVDNDAASKREVMPQKIRH